MNIILTGMRGSGKSYYGKRLSKLLGWEFIDTDDLIVQKASTPIPEIVQQHGWKHFRKLEHEITAKVATLDEHVISTGGGLIIDRENEQLLRQNGKVIFLYRTPEKCAEYISQGYKKKDRPALTDRDILDPAQLREELEEIWQKREKRYRESADLIIDVTEDTDPQQILEQLQDF